MPPSTSCLQPRGRRCWPPLPRPALRLARQPSSRRQAVSGLQALQTLRHVQERSSRISLRLASQPASTSQWCSQAEAAQLSPAQLHGSKSSLLARANQPARSIPRSSSSRAQLRHPSLQPTQRQHSHSPASLTCQQMATQLSTRSLASQDQLPRRHSHSRPHQQPGPQQAQPHRSQDPASDLHLLQQAARHRHRHRARASRQQAPCRARPWQPRWRPGTATLPWTLRSELTQPSRPATQPRRCATTQWLAAVALCSWSRCLLLLLLCCWKACCLPPCHSAGIIRFSRPLSC